MTAASTGLQETMEYEIVSLASPLTSALFNR